MTTLNIAYGTLLDEPENQHAIAVDGNPVIRFATEAFARQMCDALTALKWNQDTGTLAYESYRTVPTVQGDEIPVLIATAETPAQLIRNTVDELVSIFTYYEHA